MNQQPEFDGDGSAISIEPKVAQHKQLTAVGAVIRKLLQEHKNAP